MLSQEFPTSESTDYDWPRTDFSEPLGRGPDSFGEEHRARGRMKAVPQQGGGVLLVEDNPVSRRLLTRLLSASGYATQAVESAEEGLNALRRGPSPSIALVDLNLPGMNGLELIAHLSRLAPAAVPILVTAAGDDELGAALQASGVRYLRKPVDFPELLSVMDEVKPGRSGGDRDSNGIGLPSRYRH